MAVLFLLLSVKFFLIGSSVFSERSDVILFGLSLRIFPRKFSKFFTDEKKYS